MRFRCHRAQPLDLLGQGCQERSMLLLSPYELIGLLSRYYHLLLLGFLTVGARGWRRIANSTSDNQKWLIV